MIILITGASGQLGSEIKELSTNYTDFNFLFTDSETLDITNYNEVELFVKTHNINAIINCAAYTNVDGAETTSALAYNVNADGVKNLVNVSEKYNLKLIHISTDYVFDGTNFKPYKVTDITNPLGVYGASKRKGELFVLQSSADAIVIRTSWVYSFYGANFVKTMLRLGQDKDALTVIYDHIGAPTYAKDLAKVCLQILQENKTLKYKSNLYHYANEGVTSWFDFAKKIMQTAKLDCVIKPIASVDYQTKAKRPYYSLLDTSKIKTDFNIAIPYWQESLLDCLLRLKK